MKNRITDILTFFLGRRNAWRIGRSLYMKARADSPNVSHLNGEESMQWQLLNRFASVQEKLVVFDVGANIGDWTWSLLQGASRLKLVDQLEIYCFEPTPSTFTVLQKRIFKHPLQKNAYLVSQALSSEDGTAEMYISGETTGTNSLHPDAMNRDQRCIQVDKTTVYTFCSRNDIAIIHFLKCDTEGHDFDILQGAKSLFDQQRIMACQFEYNHRWVYSRHYLKDVFDMFESSVYSIGKITPNGIELYQDWHPELERFFEGNYLLLHSEAFSWFISMTGKFDTYNTFCTQPVPAAAIRVSVSHG
jgi:FkbM family methyltransferase